MANDGGPAFPRLKSMAHHGSSTTRYQAEYEAYGMSLRDYFAAELYSVTIVASEHGSRYDAEDFEGAARDAYRRADAMLAEREKGQ